MMHDTLYILDTNWMQKINMTHGALISRARNVLQEINLVNKRDGWYYYKYHIVLARCVCIWHRISSANKVMVIMHEMKGPRNIKSRATLTKWKNRGGFVILRLLTHARILLTVYVHDRVIISIFLLLTLIIKNINHFIKNLSARYKTAFIDENERWLNIVKKYTSRTLVICINLS